MLGENGTEKKGGEKRSIRPTRLMILTRLDKIKPDFYFFLVESMIGKSFKYNGQELNKTTAEREVLAEVEWRKLNTSDESKKID